LVIVAIGDELVTGQTVDTNSAWLAEQVRVRGARVRRLVVVGDDVEQIAGVFRQGLDQADWVIATGGLGPTADDLTRAGIARAIGVKLEESREALGRIEAFFERWQRPMPAGNRLQALLPGSCAVVPNPRGTAPGVWYRGPRSQLVALPGVPGEMKAMFADSVAASLGAAASGRVGVVRRVNTFGLPEAVVGEAIADLMVRARNPAVGTTASGGVISIRVVGAADSAAEAEALVAADVAEVRQRLGSVVFGDGDEALEHAVARLLMAAGKTVATAESCTGGLLAKTLTDVPGSSAYFIQGYITYSNRAKTALLGVPADLLELHGAVSGEVAEAMARGCRAAAGTDFALATTGIAGPDGGRPPERPVGLVYVALADAAGVRVERLLLGAHLSRAEIRDRAAKVARNMLRLSLLGWPAA